MISIFANKPAMKKIDKSHISSVKFCNAYLYVILQNSKKDKKRALSELFAEIEFYYWGKIV